MFGGPVGDDAFELVELTVEEMAGARDNHKSDACVFLELGCEASQLLDVAKLIVFAVDQEQGFTASREKTEVILLERRSDANQVRDTRIIYANV